MQSSNQQCKAFSIMQACSNHGKCDGITGSCICDNGWSSIGDFSTQYGLHCSINMTAIQIMWILVLITSPLPLYFALKLFMLRWQSVKKNETNVKNDPLMVVAILFFVCPLADGILSILKIINQERFAIALHPASTVIYLFFFNAGVMGAMTYISILVNFIISSLKAMSTQSKQSIKAQCEIIQKLAYFFIFATPILTCSPLINLTYPGHDYQTLVAFLAASLLVTGFIIFAIVRHLIVIGNEIDKHFEHLDASKIQNIPRENDPLVKFRYNLKMARIAVFFLGMEAMVMYGLFIFIDFLSINSSYLWPVIMLLVNIVLCFLLKSTMNGSANSSASDPRQSKDIEKIDEDVVENNETSDTHNKSKVSYPTNDEHYVLQMNQGSSFNTDDVKNTNNKIVPHSSELAN